MVKPEVSLLSFTSDSISVYDLMYAMVDRGWFLQFQLSIDYSKANLHMTIAKAHKETADQFQRGIAAYPEFHPQAESSKKDLEYFKQKVDAGADSAITQYFFNVDAYYQFIDDCEIMGIDIPIPPGIMPITNYTNLPRFSGACGAEIPRWIRRRLQDFQNDTESLKAFGVEVVSDMCQRLLDNGAPGLHFYSMNQTEATLAIWNHLKE